MKFFLIIIITLFLVNCANPYKINFISSRDQMIGGNWKFPFEPAGKDDIVKLYVTDDLSSAEDAFLENGYVKLGSSMFNSSPVDKQSAINFAKTIGASVVVIKSRYTGTIT
ncbi:hypothetical protein KA977_12260, partial [Candidatus Dependentiae bacterium]|nr:hypothetical protein [Candidatus Dependentiae bacterium]